MRAGSTASPMRALVGVAEELVGTGDHPGGEQQCGADPEESARGTDDAARRHGRPRFSPASRSQRRLESHRHPPQRVARDDERHAGQRSRPRVGPHGLHRVRDAVGEADSRDPRHQRRDQHEAADAGRCQPGTAGAGDAPSVEREPPGDRDRDGGERERVRDEQEQADRHRCLSAMLCRHVEPHPADVPAGDLVGDRRLERRVADTEDALVVDHEVAERDPVDDLGLQPGKAEAVRRVVLASAARPSIAASGAGGRNAWTRSSKPANSTKRSRSRAL